MKLDVSKDFLGEIESIDDDSSLMRGKNSKSTIVAHGINFDSNEEVDVYEWLLEAENKGFISDIEYQPKSFVLFDGLKNEKGKFVVRPHVYTADFKFKVTEKWRKFQSANKIKVFNKLIRDDGCVYIDVKGAFNRFGGDRNFGVNSKWVLAKYGIYVWKIEPKDLFKKAWLPEKCVFTKKTNKISKKYAVYHTFSNSKFVL